MAITAPTSKQLARMSGFDYSIKATQPLKDFCDAVVASVGTIPNYAPPVADTTALKAITASNRANGQIRVVEYNGSGKPTAYCFSSTSVAAESLPKIVQPTAGSGRWLALQEDELDLSLIPTSGQKAALAGTGTPGAGDPYVSKSTLDKMISGTATIALGASQATVTLSAAFNGKPVMVTFKTPTTAISAGAIGYLTGEVAAGNLVISHIGKDAVLVNLASAQNVYYIVDGR